jgi:hypothetical protein
MNTIHRVRLTLAHRASPPGRANPQASQPKGKGLHLASQPGHDGFAARFIQDLVAAASAAADQNRPAPTTTSSQRRKISMPCLLHTIQLCIHCRQSPAGFCVSRTSGQTVRRPWCLSCCQDLDPGRYQIKPFDS